MVSVSDSPTPRALLTRITAGDGPALGEFYDLFAGLVNALALRILRDAADAEDVVQEVFVQVWRQAGRFDALRGSPEAWLCTIARTRALDRLRRRAARREEPEAEDAGHVDAPRSEETLAVRKALGTLPPEQRRALELAYFEGLSQTEIATRLGAPLGTVKTRMRTGMLRLRELLAPIG
jgi:RNA polymerase sigma-70 factor (ECF subfamily)